jgi:ketosteroid isomerase-like protein
MRSPEATLVHHLEAIAARSVEAIMQDYRDDSVLFTPTGPIVGLAGIRAFFTAFITDSPPELFRALAITRQDIHGEVAYICWQAAPFIPYATDTFVIQAGVIVAQSFAILPPA